MKAKVHYETRHATGSVEWVHPADFDGFCLEVAEATINSNGHGFLQGSKVAIRLGSITYIELLEE